MLKNLKDKKILILGFGKEGIDSYLALRKLFPNKVLAIADRKKAGEFDKKTQKIFTKNKSLKLHLGENYLEKVGDYNFIIKTPGIPEKVYKKFIKRGGVITSQTEIFFDNFPGLIIGVTGTKGKGTTSGLIYQILKTAGLKAYWLGNVGSPVFQYLLKARPDHIAVYELSSHQLQNFKKSPQIAVFLNLFTDHLDYYRNFAEYQKAKANIASHQTNNDFLIYNSSDKLVSQIAKKSRAKKIIFNLKKPLTPLERSLKGSYRLKGDFNFLNLRAALAVVKLFNITNKTVIKAVKSFKGLPHRLEFVGKYKGIDFYNNSMATIPQATILDIKTFNGRPISLIVGGSDKGSDYKALSEEISKTSVKNLIVLGQGTGQKIASMAKHFGPKNLNRFKVKSMREAVKICYEKTPKNGVCLLSPASASFNMFKNYQDRGNQFKKWVKK